MALSEQEQRLLDELERNLYSNDRDRVVRVDPRAVEINYRSLVIGILVVVLGIIGLIVGAAVQQPIVGVASFAVMFGGAMFGLNAFRPQNSRRS